MACTAAGLHKARREQQGAHTEWWQYSDGHWDGEDQDADLGYCPPAGWGTVELRRVAERPSADEPDAANTNSNSNSNLEGMEDSGPQTSETQEDGTEEVGYNNIPIAQFSGSGPDWRGGRARVTAAACGEVITEPKEGGYIGAKAQTNNTGELTGMYEMICRALARPAGSGNEALCTDSLYAKHMTTGHWTPRVQRNAVLVQRLRNKWRELRRARPGEVRIEHVRSHTMVLGNEIADWLAERGTTSEGVTAMMMTQWIDQWAAKRRESERRRVGRVDAARQGHSGRSPSPPRRQGDG